MKKVFLTLLLTCIFFNTFTHAHYEIVPLEELLIEDDYISPEQLFYDLIVEQWMTQEELTTNTVVFNASNNRCASFNKEAAFGQSTIIYHIFTMDPYLLSVDEQDLLIHNAHNVAPLLTIRFSWSFGEGMEFTGITIGTTSFGTLRW